MLASLLARYSAHGQREVDGFAAWVSAIERLRDHWQQGKRLEVRRLRKYLDGVPASQRSDAMQDLIAEHLTLSWQAGIGMRLEAYFAECGKEFAALSSPEFVPAEIVEDEFLARYQLPHGDMPSIQEYQQRFPTRADVNQVLAERCLDGGRFVKLHKRGLGAFGEVWEAHDHRSTPGRRVAIKEPRADLSDKAEALRCFAEEARLMAELEHPGIATMREHQPRDGATPFYVMRLVDGPTLSQLIQEFHLPSVERGAREQRLRWKQLLETFVMICDAMEYAHARGVLHRDLKPANIVVQESGRAVILDWGMARRQFAVKNPAIKRGDREIVGTPDYMPPEQADGVTDTRSDIFSLGAILYEILTGRSPHGWVDGARPSNWQELVRRAQFTPPRRLRPQTPRVLESICRKALAREREKRYQSVGNLAADIGHFLAGKSVSTSTKAPWVEAWRSIRRTLNPLCAFGSCPRRHPSDNEPS